MESTPIYEEIKRLGYDITSKEFILTVNNQTNYSNRVINFSDGKDRLIKLDLFTYLNEDFTMGLDKELYKYTENKWKQDLAVAKYKGGFDSVVTCLDKRSLVTAEYYVWHQQKIDRVMEGFSIDIYGTILGKVQYVPRSLFNMALVCKDFYRSVSKVVVVMKQVQLCPKCNVVVYSWSIEIGCMSCHYYKQCLEYLCHPIVGVFECIGFYADHVTFARMACVSRMFYSLAKCSRVQDRIGVTKCDVKSCSNQICVTDKAMDMSYIRCGTCLGNVVHDSSCPKLGWARCYNCMKLFVVKKRYDGKFPRCVCCRLNFLWMEFK